jgi:hypothetical protein
MTGERGVGWGLEERKRGRGSEKFLSAGSDGTCGELS